MRRTANIIGWDNGGGLSRDIQLIQQELTALGWTVSLNSNRPGTISRTFFSRAMSRARRRIRATASAAGVVRKPFDVNLHLEEISEEQLSLAGRNVLIPNQEWFRESSRPFLPVIDEVWTKTHLASQVFSNLGCTVRYLGWMGNDRRIEDMRGRNPFKALHIAGASLWKGTDAVLDVWCRHPSWPSLVVLRRTHGYDGQRLPWSARVPCANIEIISEHLDDRALKVMQNECALHVCPSEAEGFGHVLLESMSTEALTITTDAPPMNEMITRETGLLAAAERSEPMHLGMRYFVDRAALERTIETALSMSERERKTLGAAARSRFDSSNGAFRGRLREYMLSARH